ncbi:hypothetical protein N5T80_02865 [Aliarcobacter cryaerophilus]|uniref:hypothetical protein n=1 Tax=Aliarcobacter cryaerophilus TaxID=28198 RepID=UPI00082E99BD|nr:hypothetical protein [Aliarcobacter cryaerophilus]MCT7545255.1 hypothetical protein [Aliarcobacter cryaerophilus]
MKTVEAEWIRINTARLRYGMNRNFLYNKIKSKQIISTLISKRIRLLSVKSIEEFLASSID